MKLDSAYTDPTGATANVTSLDDIWADAPRINQLDIPFGADVVVAEVGRSKIVLGQGGYYAPRS